jgi:hypothetical protein
MAESSDATAVSEQYVVDDRGQRTAVIVPIGRYEELLGDLHDLAVVAERRDEPTVTLDVLKQRLGR